MDDDNEPMEAAGAEEQVDQEEILQNKKFVSIKPYLNFGKICVKFLG
jgi:hypothetical protein